MRADCCTIGGHLDAPAHLRALLANMLQDPQLHSLCDVVLIVQDERFPAHRAVLAAVSTVFKAMFTNSMRERSAPEIQLHSLDKRAWRMAMHYIYHAQLDIHDEPTALLLLATARMYHLLPLERFVQNFLVSRVRLHNCFSLLHHAQHYNLPALENACLRAMHANFEALSLSPAFLQCPYSLLSRLLVSGALVVKCETLVFDAIQRWVQARRQQRIKHLPQLLCQLRLQSLSDAQLAVIVRAPLVADCLAFRELVLQHLTRPRHDDVDQRALRAACHLKPCRRDANVFSFCHVQRAVTRMPAADDEEIVRTPWALDRRSAILWRLKIYPRGYGKAKDLFLSMYVQARSASHHQPLDLTARFDIFLVNRNDPTQTVSFSSSHHFTDLSDHWGFHRFLQLSQMRNTALGFLDEQSDSLLLGATMYLPSTPADGDSDDPDPDPDNTCCTSSTPPPQPST
ncbi:unnamed protein product [Agarophyton chilense]